ncbi:hypothetical protein PSTG_07291 [Puccinia striiformis f. sp. tritici PST-78]|uniref:Uncharacterized protein n=1 Tax=Puccinia striiformis f. sp. tritici PST-78 TaxID=1165861 RepID=A0A0L0VJX5_9BASI|nr:hypothetical protein PSTG_07291 [Puccinia striiformis f. sp. tritici PST-78]
MNGSKGARNQIALAHGLIEVRWGSVKDTRVPGSVYEDTVARVRKLASSCEALRNKKTNPNSIELNLNRLTVTPRCDGCRRRNEDCNIPSSATRGDRLKCEGCRLRRVACITSNSVTPHSSNANTERGRTENNLIIRRPGVDYDIKLIQGDFTIENPENRATTPPTREIPPTRRPPTYDQFERERLANEEAARKKEQEKKKKEEEEAKKKKDEEEKKKKREEEKKKTLDGAIRRRDEEAKRKENEAMRIRGEAIRRSVQEEVDRCDSRIPSLEEEMSRSAIDEAGSRIDTGGDYIMKNKAKKPKKSKKCRESKISDRFEDFYAMQLLVLKKMGVYVDEEDIEDFKDLIKDINEGLVLLEEDIKKM